MPHLNHTELLWPAGIYAFNACVEASALSSH